MAKQSPSANVATVPEPVPALIPIEDVWANLDQVDRLRLSADLESKLRLIGVPFLITNVTYREADYSKPGTANPYYMSVEATIAPEFVEPTSERIRRREKAAKDLPGLVVDDFPQPGADVVFNDMSTGVYRVLTAYIASTFPQLVQLDHDDQLDMTDLSGKLGESVFDQGPDDWREGGQAGKDGIALRLFCARGLRASHYGGDGEGPEATTFYLA